MLSVPGSIAAPSGGASAIADFLGPACCSESARPVAADRPPQRQSLWRRVPHWWRAGADL